MTPRIIYCLPLFSLISLRNLSPAVAQPAEILQAKLEQTGTHWSKLFPISNHVLKTQSTLYLFINQHLWKNSGFYIVRLIQWFGSIFHIQLIVINLRRTWHQNFDYKNSWKEKNNRKNVSKFDENGRELLLFRYISLSPIVSVLHRIFQMLYFSFITFGAARNDENWLRICLIVSIQKFSAYFHCEFNINGANILFIIFYSSSPATGRSFHSYRSFFLYLGFRALAYISNS